jgi:methionine sulfoxide reductase heme-binding subunit
MSRSLSSWQLFWALALLVSAIDCIGLSSADLHTSRGTVPVILLAVRCALPFFVVAFTASSLAVLWPGGPTRWLLSNRRYFGLTFAFGMAWHFALVGYSFSAFGVHLNRTVITLDLIGATFLLALTLTSFRWASRHLSARAWRRLHKTGVYAIWLLATYIYAEAVRWGADLFNLLALAILLAAWALRLAAWVHRLQARRSGVRPSQVSL